MRLLNCRTRQLESDFAEVPPYAILSHRWLEKRGYEPTFQDMQLRIADLRPGYEKIMRAADQALRMGFEYIWADTICINKENHVEFSEAINSMYRYYNESGVCYAYLADVQTKEDMPRSEWFKRGWTLQELLAPLHVEFYSRDWKCLGTRSDVDMSNILSEATGICSKEVFQIFRPGDWTVAERMSWASKRVTKRREDIAYCLLGIFEVTMPLLYGEGDNAFIRLQHEIMRLSNDHSIFAWKDAGVLCGSLCGLLARSPVQFGHFCSELNKYHWKPSDVAWDEEYPTPWSMTNLGIQIELPLAPAEEGLPSMYYALLGYRSKTYRPAILVTRLHNGNFARIHADLLIKHNDEDFVEARTRQLAMTQLLVKQRAPTLRSAFKSSGFALEYSQVTNTGFLDPVVTASSTWDRKKSVLRGNRTLGSAGQVAVLKFVHGRVGVEFELTVWRTGDIQLASQQSISAPLMLNQKNDTKRRFVEKLILHSEAFEHLVIVLTACTFVEFSKGERPFYTILVQASIERFTLSLAEQRFVTIISQLTVGCVAVVGVTAAHDHIWKPVFTQWPAFGSVLFTLAPVLGSWYGDFRDWIKDKNISEASEAYNKGLFKFKYQILGATNDEDLAYDKDHEIITTSSLRNLLAVKALKPAANEEDLTNRISNKGSELLRALRGLRKTPTEEDLAYGHVDLNGTTDPAAAAAGSGSFALRRLLKG